MILRARRITVTKGRETMADRIRKDAMSDAYTAMIVCMMPVWWVVEAALLCLCWAWFAVPLGARMISGWHAFGMTTAFALARTVSAEPMPEWIAPPSTYWMRHLLKYGGVAVTAYIAHRGMA
jgi:hypothetical protein